jgi:hypothetical protein
LNADIVIKAEDLNVNTKDFKNSVLSSLEFQDDILIINNLYYRKDKLLVLADELKIDSKNKTFDLDIDSASVYFNTENKVSDFLIIPQIIISCISADSYFNENLLEIDSILINSPLYFYKSESKSESNSSTPKAAFKINAIDSLRLKYFGLSSGHIILQEAQTDVPANNIDEVSLSAFDLRLDLTNRFSFDHSVKLNDLQFAIPKIDFYSGDSLYRINIYNAGFSLRDDQFLIDSFNLRPELSAEEFFERVGYQTDRMELDAHQFVINGVNYIKLLEGEIFIDNMSVNKLILNSFRDKRYPFPEWQRRKLPVSMLRSLELPVNISNIELKDSYIKYSEQVEGSLYPGSVFLEDMNVTISNLTNRSMDKFNAFDTTTANVSCKLMGEGFLEANLRFPLQ